MEKGDSIQLEGDGSVILYDEMARRQVVMNSTTVDGRCIHITTIPGNPDLVGRLIDLERTVVSLQAQISALQSRNSQ